MCIFTRLYLNQFTVNKIFIFALYQPKDTRKPLSLNLSSSFASFSIALIATSSSSSNQGVSKSHRSPHCQICRINSHYANVCPNRYKNDSTQNTTNLAEAFSAGRQVPLLWRLIGSWILELLPI